MYRFLSTVSCKRTSRLFCTKSPNDKIADDKRVPKYSDYDKKTIYGEEYPIWHKPLTERPDEFRSKFQLLSLEKLNFTQSDPIDESKSWLEIYNNWYRREMEKLEIEDQEYNANRQTMLGYDLATAHFVCYRGGAVKFLNDDKWIKKERGKYGFEVQLSPNFVPGLYLEAVDFENFMNGGVRYEGLENLVNLEYLKWMSFKNNTRFNNWSLDRISNIVNETVEYLDIRGTNATYRGLNALYRFKNLKFLQIDVKYENEEDNKMAEHMYALLQEHHKDLLIKIDERN